MREEYPKDEALHRIADELMAVQKRYGYTVRAVFNHHHHYGLQFDDIEATRSTDNDIRAYAIAPEAERQLKDAIKRFNTWIYDALRAEDEYRSTDAYIRETLENNDDEYDEYGSLET